MGGNPQEVGRIQVTRGREVGESDSGGLAGYPKQMGIDLAGRHGQIHARGRMERARRVLDHPELPWAPADPIAPCEATRAATLPRPRH